MTGIFDRRNLKRILTGFVTILGLLFFGWLLWYNFRYTYYFVPEYNEQFIIEKDNILLHIVVFIVCFIGICCLCRFMDQAEERKKKKCMRCLLFITMAAVTLAGGFWVSIVHAQPCADQLAVLQSTFSLMDGNYDVLKAENYLGEYPFQLGTTALFQLLFTIFKTRDYHLIQYLNVLCLPVIIYAGYRIIKNAGGGERAEAVYCVFVLCCFPLIFYTPFVYGEVFSIMAGMLMIWGVMEYLQRKKKVFFFVIIFSAIFGVMTRGNFWVLIVAVCIILGLYAIKEKSFLLLLLGALTIIAPLLCNKGVRFGYEQRSGIQVDQGVPFISFVALGIHDEGNQPPGWTNLHDHYAYVSGGYNSEAAAEISEDYIRQRMKAFREGSADWKYYLKEKILTQWEEPTYQSLLANHDFAVEPTGFVYDIYYGKLKNGLHGFLNEYQWLLYLGTCLSFWYCWYKKKPFYTLLLEITMIGGFLFSIIWEAKTRHIFPYLVYMLPCAAIGLTEAAEKAAGHAVKFQHRG